MSTLSTVLDSLDQKIRDMETDICYIQRYRDGLIEAFYNNLLESEELAKALEEINVDDDETRKGE